jgi:hypothetical protein
VLEFAAPPVLEFEPPPVLECERLLELDRLTFGSLAFRPAAAAAAADDDDDEANGSIDASPKTLSNGSTR